MLDYKKIAKLEVQEVMKDLPKKLKDPSCYEPIEKQLMLCMYSDHKHRDLRGFTKCKRCQAKHHKRREMIKEFGFKSLEQYMGWKRIMDVIYNKRPIMVNNKFVK